MSSTSPCQGLEEPGCCGQGAHQLGSHSSLCLACGPSEAVTRWPVVFSFSSKHYPLYSLNVASMYLKLGRLYMGLENKAAGERALKKVRV